MDTEELNKLRVTDLRKELGDRGLSQKGVKSELVERLQEAMSAEAAKDGADAPTASTDAPAASADAPAVSEPAQEAASAESAIPAPESVPAPAAPAHQATTEESAAVPEGPVAPPPSTESTETATSAMATDSKESSDRREREREREERGGDRGDRDRERAGTREERDKSERDRSSREDRDKGDRERSSRDDRDKGDRERGREREGGDRERRRDRSGERRRDRSSERSDRRERPRERSSERKRTRHSRSRSGSRERTRRRRSRSPEIVPLHLRKRRLEDWDMVPPGCEGMTAQEVKALGIFGSGPAVGMAGGAPRRHDRGPNPGEVPHPAGLQRIFINGDGESGGSGAGIDEAHQARQARRLYCGNIPFGLTDEEMASFFAQTMLASGLGHSAEGPVIGASVNQEKNFSFVEFRTPEDATAGLALDGVSFKGVSMRIRRPKDYIPPNNDGSYQSSISNQVPDGPDKIWIGGLPYYFNEDQVKELLSAFGELRAFHLARDGMGKSKGYAFCEYIDHNLTDLACAGLNGMEVGGRTLVVQKSQTTRRDGTGGNFAPPPTAGFGGQPAFGGFGDGSLGMPVGPILPPPPPITFRPGLDGGPIRMGFPDMPPIDDRRGGNDGGDASDLGGGNNERGPYGPRGGSYGGRGGGGGSGGPMSFVRAGQLVGEPTRVLQLLNMVVPNELQDDEEYRDIVEDIRDECTKFGPVRAVVIPRPRPDGQPVPGLGKVFVEFAAVEGCAAASQALAGRKFAQRVVAASFFSEQRFAQNEF